MIAGNFLPSTSGRQTAALSLTPSGMGTSKNWNLMSEYVGLESFCCQSYMNV